MTAEAPEYLYHYTNVETLALILKNRTIRFNSLDKVDDPQEQKTADIKNAGQFCYVSCWTDDATESIPMWNMYSGLASGVRIRLRKNPFKWHELTEQEHQQYTWLEPYTKTMIPFPQMVQKEVYSFPEEDGSMLYKVDYSDEEKKLSPNMLYSDEIFDYLDFYVLGKCKSTYWAFQNEWRYILYASSVPIHQDTQQGVEAILKERQRVIDGVAKQPFPEYYMDIADDAFADMEITLSPRISAGNKLIAETLMRTYNPSAGIRDSDLLGKL